MVSDGVANDSDFLDNQKKDSSEDKGDGGVKMSILGDLNIEDGKYKGS